MNRYIGIDLGTSSVKILLVRADGEIEKTISREYPISYPHSGWSEQNPSDWYEQTIDGLKERLSGADKASVKGVSFGGQMHGLVLLDENDEVIRPAILWNDGRTASQTSYLNEVIGQKKLMEYTERGGDVADPWYTDRFDVTYRDILEGCEALLKALEEERI